MSTLTKLAKANNVIYKIKNPHSTTSPPSSNGIVRRFCMKKGGYNMAPKPMEYGGASSLFSNSCPRSLKYLYLLQ